jgi:tetratricopeptide (TPR) repeat protein
MHRKSGTLIFLLAILAFAVPALVTPALAQMRNPEALPQAQSANGKALAATALKALAARQWGDAEAALKQLVSAEPRWEYADALGAMQGNQGHYQDAIASYQRALDLAQGSAAPAAIAAIYVGMGNANLKLKQNDAAVTAYGKAAALDPYPATAYFNLCATLYNLGKTGAEGVAACDKAIAADPKKADAFFIKGSMLFGDSKIDKNNRIVVPPGTVEALKQYLVLAPTGAHASDVNQMLDALK